MVLLKMFQRKWIFATLLVLAGTALCIRLGIWQLDRLAQRRAENAHITAMWSLPPMNLNAEASQNLTQMEYRTVQVTGEYDFANQVVLRNQYYNGELGYHLLTPLRFNNSVVLIDRGWIPADGNSTSQDWHKYDETGTVTVSGQLRLGQTKPAFGGVADAPLANGARLETWNNADLTRIASQMPYPILPVYIQPQPDPGDTQPPIPFQPEVEITEGPHMGYAIQWFTFATLLFVGYPFYLRKQEAGSR